MGAASKAETCPFAEDIGHLLLPLIVHPHNFSVIMGHSLEDEKEKECPSSLEIYERPRKVFSTHLRQKQHAVSVSDE